MSAKILIVDDQESIRNMLSELLGMAGYTYEMAQNGVEAVELRERAGDQVRHPGDGEDAEIRALPELEQTPILFLTARGQAQDEEKIRTAGGNALMTKPFSPRQVLEKIKALLGER